jgi:hypothetical protein
MDQDTVPNNIQTIRMFFEKYNVKQDGVTPSKLKLIYSAIMYALTDVPREDFMSSFFEYLKREDTNNPIYNDSVFMGDVSDVWSIYVELFNVFPFNVKEDGTLEVVNLKRKNIKPHYWEALHDAFDTKNINLKIFPLLFYQGMKSPVASFMDVIRNKRKAISSGTPGGSRPNKKRELKLIISIHAKLKRVKPVPDSPVPIIDEEAEALEETVQPSTGMMIFKGKSYEYMVDDDIVDMSDLHFFADLLRIMN